MVRQRSTQHIISVVILIGLLGCSGSTEYIHRTKFIVQEKTDTIYTQLVKIDTLYETTILIDSILVGVDTSGYFILPIYEGVKLNAKKDTAVIARFYWEDKHFEIWQRADTLYKTDTIIVNMPYIPEGAEGWEKIIYLIGGLIIAFFVWRIRKKNGNKKIIS